MSRAPCFALCGTLGLSLLSAPLAAAEAATNAAVAPAADAPPPHVQLVLVGDAPGANALLERAASWFRDPNVTTEATRAASVDAAAVFARSAATGVRIWIWLRTTSAARVFVAAHEPETGAERYWVSDVALRSGLDELGSEELAQLVHLSALAVWSGNLESRRSEVEAGLKPAPAASPAPPDSARGATTAATPRQRTFTVGAEYCLRFAGDEGVPQLLGAVLGVAFRGPQNELGLRLHAGALLPRNAKNSELQLSLNGGSAALEAAAAWRQSQRLWLTAAVGPGLDVVRYRATSTDALEAEPASTDVRPFAQAGVGLRVDVGAVSLSATALVLAQWLHVHYDVSRAGQRDAVLTPWLVQPGAAVGATW